MTRTRTIRQEQLPVVREVRKDASPDGPRRRPVKARRLAAELKRKANMLEAYLEAHPHRERAWERLIGDIQQAAVEREQNEYDMSCDSDYDGMG